MEFFTDEGDPRPARQQPRDRCAGPDGFYDVGTGPGASEGDYIDWLTIADQAQSVTADVRRIKEHPLVPRASPSTATSTT